MIPLVGDIEIPKKSKRASPLIIERLEGAQPVSVKRYPLKHGAPVEIKPIIATFIDQELLREYRSPYNTPILPIQKPNGNYQLVQDLRAINTISRTLHPVVANPCTLLTKLQSGWVWFSALDLKDAFFCLPFLESSQEIYAFEWENPKTGEKASLHGPYCHKDSKNSLTRIGDH